MWVTSERLWIVAATTEHATTSWRRSPVEIVECDFRRVVLLPSCGELVLRVRVA
jgi:hypothetical protein